MRFIFRSGHFVGEVPKLLKWCKSKFKYVDLIWNKNLKTLDLFLHKQITYKNIQDLFQSPCGIGFMYRVLYKGTITGFVLQFTSSCRDIRHRAREQRFV